MAINKKLIHFKKYSDFVGNSGINGVTSPINGYYHNIHESSIVFIQDTKQIWTHGLLYDGSTFDPTDIEASILNLLNNKVDKANIKTINGQSVLGNGDIEVSAEVLKFENMTASSWIADSTYADFGYVCNLPCSGVTEDMYAEVVFDVALATSGNYAPVCETDSDVVKIWSSTNSSIIIPVIIVQK